MKTDNTLQCHYTERYTYSYACSIKEKNIIRFFGNFLENLEEMCPSVIELVTAS